MAPTERRASLTSLQTSRFALSVDNRATHRTLIQTQAVARLVRLRPPWPAARCRAPCPERLLRGRHAFSFTARQRLGAFRTMFLSGPRDAAQHGRSRVEQWPIGTV